MREGVKSHNSISGSARFPRWEHRGLIENCPDCVAHKIAADELKELRKDSIRLTWLGTKDRTVFFNKDCTMYIEGIKPFRIQSIRKYIDREMEK